EISSECSDAARLIRRQTRVRVTVVTRIATTATMPIVIDSVDETWIAFTFSPLSAKNTACVTALTALRLISLHPHCDCQARCQRVVTAAPHVRDKAAASQRVLVPCGASRRTASRK